MDVCPGISQHRRHDGRAGPYEIYGRHCRDLFHPSNPVLLQSLPAVLLTGNLQRLRECCDIYLASRPFPDSSDRKANCSLVPAYYIQTRNGDLGGAPRKPLPGPGTPDPNQAVVCNRWIQNQASPLYHHQSSLTESSKRNGSACCYRCFRQSFEAIHMSNLHWRRYCQKMYEDVIFLADRDIQSDHHKRCGLDYR